MEHVMSFLGAFKPSAAPCVKVCEKHGQFSSKNVFGHIWTKCPACQTEREEEEKRQLEEKEKAAAQDAWMRKLGESGIPPRFQKRTLKTYIADTDGQKAALAFAKDYAREVGSGSSGRCAIFIGEPGTGKTHIACGIALRAMYNYSATALFTTVSKMTRRIREAKSFDSEETETEAIQVFTYPDILIIDEVGIQTGSDAESRAVFDVINDRYEKCKGTLFLSNLGLSEVKNVLGPRVFDRIREDGGEVLVFDWGSQRGKL